MEPPSEYAISRLKKDDPIEDVVRLEAASFSHPWPREMLARELQNESVARVYVLRNGRGELLAFCGCWFIADELHINTLAVRAEARRRGLATRLMRHVFAEALAAGARRATLEVRRSNVAALKLYDGLGFEIHAIRPHYYADPIEDGLILWKPQLDAFARDPQP